MSIAVGSVQVAVFAHVPGITFNSMSVAGQPKITGATASSISTIKSGVVVEQPMPSVSVTFIIPGPINPQLTVISSPEPLEDPPVTDQLNEFPVNGVEYVTPGVPGQTALNPEITGVGTG